MIPAAAIAACRLGHCAAAEGNARLSPPLLTVPMLLRRTEGNALVAQPAHDLHGKPQIAVAMRRRRLEILAAEHAGPDSSSQRILLGLAQGLARRAASPRNHLSISAGVILG